MAPLRMARHRGQSNAPLVANGEQSLDRSAPRQPVKQRLVLYPLRVAAHGHDK
jgi:hypothetical protein